MNQLKSVNIIPLQKISSEQDTLDFMCGVEEKLEKLGFEWLPDVINSYSIYDYPDHDGVVIGNYVRTRELINLNGQTVPMNCDGTLLLVGTSPHLYEQLCLELNHAKYFKTPE